MMLSDRWSVRMSTPSPILARSPAPRRRTLPAPARESLAPAARLQLRALASRQATPAGPLAGWLAGVWGRRGRRVFRARVVVQSFFALLCLVLGWRFADFVDAARRGAVALPARPPGVEGFLPISGLLGLFDWIYTGTLNRIHPAATVLLLIFIASAFLLRKSFCSWICPIGFLSEALARLGRRLFGGRLAPPRWLDAPLRGVKFGLLAFFLWAILGMGRTALHDFVESPYNRLADVKMLLFFSPPGRATLIVLGVLAGASIVIQGAWCRFLCPYGALLGLCSWLSPVKVRRREDTCTNCGICDRVCMARLPVSKSLQVTSHECTGCLDCVASCPVRETLTVGSPRRRLGVLGFAAALLLLFGLGYGAARISGSWGNGIAAAEYRERIPHVDGPDYSHPGM